MRVRFCVFFLPVFCLIRQSLILATQTLVKMAACVRDLIQRKSSLAFARRDSKENIVIVSVIVEQNHKQICTLKMLFIPICYSSLLQVVTVQLK